MREIIWTLQSRSNQPPNDVEDDVPYSIVCRLFHMSEELEQEREGRKNFEAEILHLEGELERLRALS